MHDMITLLIPALAPAPARRSLGAENSTVP